MSTSHDIGPMDRLVAGITIAVQIVLLGACVVPAYAAFALWPDAASTVACALVGAFVACLSLYFWTQRTLRISIQGDRLRIHNRIGVAAEASLEAIKDVSACDPVFTKSIRVGGTGGVWGYYGEWRSKELGHFKAYACRNSDLVRIGFHDGSVWILSVRFRGAFIADLQGSLSALRG